jgi:hypothetical protein
MLQTQSEPIENMVGFMRKYQKLIYLISIVIKMYD